MLNINLRHNEELMQKCKKLREYAQFVAKIRIYLQKGYETDRAIDCATDDCIKEEILAGIEIDLVFRPSSNLKCTNKI